jgi:hypothetical protein
MSGRHGRSALKDQVDPQDVLHEEATRTARVIAGLRGRLLQTPETLEHPKVRSELHLFEKQVARQLAYIAEGRGRHRSASEETMSQHANGASGSDLKPDLLDAKTPAAFIEALWQYRAWSGDPPWRTMAERADQAVVHSTMYNAMNGDALPKLLVVRAIIIGCGGNEEDVSSFVNAWRRLAVSKARDRDWRPRTPSELATMLRRLPRKITRLYDVSE